MTLTVKQEQTEHREYKLVPPGMHLAVCYAVYDIGPQVSSYKGVDKELPKIRLQFEVPNERTTWTDADGNEHEGPMSVGKTYTASLYEKAKLCEHLESWRGRQFTETEKMGFDLSNLIGKACMLTLMHRTNKERGNTWADIVSIGPVPKGMSVEGERDPVIFDFDNHTDEEFRALPEWLQGKVEEGKALLARQRARVPQYPQDIPEPVAPVDVPNDDVEDDDIPF